MTELFVEVLEGPDIVVQYSFILLSLAVSRGLKTTSLSEEERWPEELCEAKSDFESSFLFCWGEM